jgi:MoxR-like ATPase
MTPIELENALGGLITYSLQRSVMIWGPPGVGKSSIVSQMAARHKLDVIDVRLSQLAPTDLRGLPVADGKFARWLPPDFLPSHGAGVLFLDELNMAPPAVQGIAQQLILNRRVGNYEVPPEWFVWAAGNRKEDRAAVFEMPAPLANRFLHYEVEPHLESFRRWALGRGIHEQVLAFLSFRPELLHKPDGKAVAWPSCRSWEMASELHEHALYIGPAVGEGAAQEFIAYCKLYKSLPDIDAILRGDGATVEFPKDPSYCFAITIGLAVRADKEAPIRNGFGWLLANAKPEWCQLYLHSIHERAASRGFLGILAKLLAEDPRMKRMLPGLTAGK